MKKILISLGVFLAISFFAAGARASTQLKWIFAHGPVDEKVLGLMKKYSHRLSLNSKDSIQVRLEKLPEGTWSSHKGWVYRWNEALKKLTDGSVDVAQIYTDELVGSVPALEVFDLPFLFRDHEHVEKVLDGEIGRELLAQLTTASGGKMRAVAFTYSGGFRVLASSKEIKNAADLKGLKISEESTRYRAGAPVVRLETFRAFGSELLNPDSTEGHISLFAKKEIAMYIAPYKEVVFDSRNFKAATPKYVSDDHMSLFATVILVSENSFQKLSKSEQSLLMSEIGSLAKEERQLFVREAEEAKVELQKMGTKVSSLSPAEVERLRALAQPVYSAFTDRNPAFAELVQRIRSTK